MGKTSTFGPVDLQAKYYKGLREPYSGVLYNAFGPAKDFFSGDLSFDGSDEDFLNRYRAPMSPGETDALAGLNAQLYGPDPNRDASEDLLGKTLGGDFLSPDSNPYFADMLKYTNQAISDEYNKEGLQQQALFARAGQELPESSPFAHASAELSKARMDAIGKNTAELSGSIYEAERARQTQAVEQRRANAEFEFRRQYEGLQANALPRLIDQMGFERGFEEYQARINAIMTALGLAADVSVPAIGQVGSSATTTPTATNYNTGGGSSRIDPPPITAET